MSTPDKQTAADFRRALASLPETDKRYIEGWLDAKADTHTHNRKKED